MRRLLDTLNRHLDFRLGLTPRLLLIAAAALIGITLLLPLWNLTMFAPQYPDGLRLDIYSYTLVGANHGQDIKEINLLNHYIGMHPLDSQLRNRQQHPADDVDLLVIVERRAMRDDPANVFARRRIGDDPDRGCVRH